MRLEKLLRESAQSWLTARTKHLKKPRPLSRYLRYFWRNYDADK